MYVEVSFFRDIAIFNLPIYIYMYKNRVIWHVGNGFIGLITTDSQQKRDLRLPCRKTVQLQGAWSRQRRSQYQPGEHSRLLQLGREDWNRRLWNLPNESLIGTVERCNQETCSSIFDNKFEYPLVLSNICFLFRQSDMRIDSSFLCVQLSFLWVTLVCIHISKSSNFDKFWRVYCRFSGLGKPCSYSLYILLYTGGFPARDEILPDTFKCSTIKRNSRTFIFFTQLSPPLAQPPRSHHNHHYHPPLSPPPLSQPPQLTQASFSHVPLSVFEGSLARKLRFHIFHFQFQQLIQETSEPCHILHLLAAHLGRATCAKKNSFMGQSLADRGYVIFWLSVHCRSGYRFGQPGWIMILGNPSSEVS